MDKVLLPDSFDPDKLRRAMVQLHMEAIKKSNGEKMNYCDGVDKFQDCFNGFVAKDGLLVLCYHWNIGARTFGVTDRFDISV